MEERQVTVEGNTFKLEKPFSVIATQNPTGASGTQLLPDSQIDHNDLGAESLRELYVLRKPGLILIIYDRIRLHIDGGKSCMKDLSHLCGGVYNPCIGRRRG